MARTAAQTIPIRSLLVLGGARSGKSRYAQRLAEESGLPPVLIATAQGLDDEMRQRIASHAAARDARWTLVEAPVALAESMGAAARADRIVLVDCATLWLSNMMLEGRDVTGATAAVVAAIAACAGPLIIVSNEVGGGIVPDNRLARSFRDAQGRLNQALAVACDAAVLVVAGMPMALKPAPAPAFLMRA